MLAITERLSDVSCIGAIQIDITFTFTMPHSTNVCHIPCRSLKMLLVEMLSGNPSWHNYKGVVLYRVGSCKRPKY